MAAGRSTQQQVGFYVAVPPDLQDDGDHVIEFRRRDGSPIALLDPLGVASELGSAESDARAQPQTGSAILCHPRLS